ncbi:Uncharacterised protein [Cedecea neteri]|uniref:Uncharacterized protein n=1 Tax=Cedecea neteri TaxID=158822 RepID=A0A2X3L0F4_9ENTR|nr:Uncharacterised protein [Cedecea neteri]
MNWIERESEIGVKKCPNGRAQARVQEQLKAINPVLANPEEFRAQSETLAPCSVLFFYL